MLGGDHGEALERDAHRLQQLDGFVPHRVRDARLHEVDVFRALLGDGVALLVLGDEAAVDELSQTVGVIKVAHAVVALAAEITQGAGFHRAGQAAQDEEDQDLDVQLFVYKSKVVHESALPCKITIILYMCRTVISRLFWHVSTAAA